MGGATRYYYSFKNTPLHCEIKPESNSLNRFSLDVAVCHSYIYIVLFQTLIVLYIDSGLCFPTQMHSDNTYIKYIVYSGYSSTPFQILKLSQLKEVSNSIKLFG